MKRIIGRAMLMAYLCMACVAIVAPQRAQAGIPNYCCNFTFVVSQQLPESCYPITLTSSWNGNVQTNTLYSWGYVTWAVQKCPPATTLDWISLDGGVTKLTTAGESAAFTLPCGACVKMAINNANECIAIAVPYVPGGC